MSRIANSMVAAIGVVVMALAIPSATSAQAAKEKKKAPAGALEIEEITVTAQKREESIQETPISVTAFTGELLDEKGLSNVVDLGTAVPGLRISTAPGTKSTTQVTLRGLSQSNFDPTYPAKVGLYVDGAYLSTLKESNFGLEDLERVEVLRGPQGTLYGKNTIAGAVNFITRKPTEERSITLKTEVGNYDAFTSRLTVNVPLVGKNGFFQSDVLGTISLRESGAYMTHDGYVRNAVPPGAPASPAPTGVGDWRNEDRLFNFTALRWQPRQDITVDYSFEYHRHRENPDVGQVSYVYPARVPLLKALGVNPEPYILKNRSDSIASSNVIGSDLKTIKQPRDDAYHQMQTLTGAWDCGDVGPLGAVTLKSISMYRSFMNDVVNAGVTGVPVHILDGNNRIDTQSWSEELQVIGGAPRIRYVAGLYYFGEYDSWYSQQVIFKGLSRSNYKNYRRNKSYAAYGQATWTPPILSDKLSVTGGLRITQEQIHLTHLVGGFSSPTGKPVFVNEGGKAFGGIHGSGAPGIDPTGDISYQWTDALMTYARVSRGFASGGFVPSGTIPQLFRPFKPESLWQFESGFKSQWLDNRVRFNADGYFSYYTDLQQTVFRASQELGVLSIPANVERAEIWGMEAEATVIPLRGVEATVGYSFLSPKYTKWLDQKFDAKGLPVFDPSGNPVLESVAGQRTFAYAPRHQLNAGLTYTAPPTTTGTFSAHLDAYWQDETVFSTNSTPGNEASEGWAYAVVNGRLAFAGIPLEKGSLDLAVFSHNLFDRKYRTVGIDFGSSLGFAINTYGDPRTFGLQLTYKWPES